MVDLSKPLSIGSEFTTAKSKVTGVIREIVENKTGSKSLRLELPDGQTHWTTVKP